MFQTANLKTQECILTLLALRAWMRGDFQLNGERRAYHEAYVAMLTQRGL